MHVCVNRVWRRQEQHPNRERRRSVSGILVVTEDLEVREASMTNAEIGGWVLAGFGIGLASGLGIAALYSRRQEWNARRRQGINAFARWLTARRVLGRSSISYLLKCRASRDAAPNSKEQENCETIVRQSAKNWNANARELDSAEAYLVTWIADPSLGDIKTRYALRLKAEIGLVEAGGHFNIVNFSKGLEEEDEAAVKVMRAVVWRKSPAQVAGAYAFTRLKWAWVQLETMANRMARR